MIERVPVEPDTVTVLGYRWKADEPAWGGLDFTKAELRGQSTIMLYLCGQKGAPFDLHLDVPFLHPEDAAGGMKWEDDECWYRVRPRAEVGKRWRGRMVKSVAIVAAPDLNPPWAIEIGRAR